MPRMGRAALHSHRDGIGCTSPKSPNQDKLGIDVKCIRCHTFRVAKLLCNNICNGHGFLILISALQFTMP